MTAEVSWPALVRCPGPGCGGPLKHRVPKDKGSALVCGRCHTLYPVLGQVPILVPEPAIYLAEHRDAVLAALAEAGEADLAAVSMVQALVAFAPKVAARPFSDDWVDSEAQGGLPPHPHLDADRPGHAGLATLLSAHAAHGLAARVQALYRPRPKGAVVELGCGAAPVLAPPPGVTHVVADLSLRAALTAASRSGAAGLVADAQALPFRPGRVSTLVALNLVDLLDDVGAFLDGAHHALARGGSLLVATPEPSLGLGDDEALQDVLQGAGFEISGVEDGVPWLRPHTERHLEVYLTQVVVARPA
ncbi:MAG: class I SAM-dependent methyltransferase [Deltaproteobacteria bacterium]|nr:class I SAM-dependent methyltransferase [Deltaproteobacteria bacterium]